MASIRKRYAERIEAGPRHDGPPVTAPPTSAAKLPDPVADPKQPEMPATESPADVAAKEAIALKLRLKEMERAEQLNRQAAEQPPQAAEPQQQPPTVEQIIANSAIPERAKAWLRQRPEYVSDPVKNNTLVALHDVAKRQSGSEFTDAYFEKMEDLLGIAPATNGQTQHRPIESPSPAPAAPPRSHEAPVRQQRSAIPVSAPPTRDVPSMATGRPIGGPVKLTAEQFEAARFSGISPQEYARQLERMNRMKASGEIDDGRR